MPCHSGISESFEALFVLKFSDFTPKFSDLDFNSFVFLESSVDFIVSTSQNADLGENLCSILDSLARSRSRKWQPTPVFLPGESQGRGSLVGCRLWGCTESDTTEAT